MNQEAVKITITYKDGSIKDLTKGIAFYFEDNGDVITGDIVSMSGKDLFIMLGAIYELGVRFGYSD